MKKSVMNIRKFFLLLIFSASLIPAFAQDDDFFSDDDFFAEDTIDESYVEESTQAGTQNSSFNKDLLKQGILFEDGSVKIGGNYSLSLYTLSALYTPEESDFATNIENTTLTPKASAYLYVDARPSQTLRMYTKFGFNYPFASNVYLESYTPGPAFSVADWFKLKELFSDFNIKDRVFFRFGLHTVTWGTGYFFSPVSDIINTSSIDPENVTEQVDGSLNLRMQITFPGTQNCLWFYMIPSTDFISAGSASSYARDTAFAAKGEITLLNWELGAGSYYKYQNAPKAMLTASGGIFGSKINVFGEFVYQYGAQSEWASNTDWTDKTNIFLVTAGFSKYWKDPSITLVGQYYFDGNDVDFVHKYYQHGHNIALACSFGRVFGSTDFTASLYGIVNFGKVNKLTEQDAATLGTNASIYEAAITNSSGAIFSAMLNYSPVKELTFGLGPYITFTNWEKEPAVNLKLEVTLGGGKF